MTQSPHISSTFTHFISCALVITSNLLVMFARVVASFAIDAVDISEECVVEFELTAPVCSGRKSIRPQAVPIFRHAVSLP